MRTITIRTEKPYDVMVGRGLLSRAGSLVKEVLKPAAVMIVSDDNVYPLYGETVKKSFEAAGIRTHVFVFPHGEARKNLETYGALQEALFDAGLTRTDMVAALGGGVVGDLAGFAASTYLRGIPCVQLPTTLLAAVDSSVGGKTAVNLSRGKNQVGTFFQPSMVLCDIETLSTLPEEEYRCGCAEIIKYAMIESEDFFEQILKTPVRDQAEEVISTCMEMKRDYVLQDEFDTGVRMMLNFGHTFGHAAESLSGYTLLHGQAVAMGMAVITRSAVTRGICTQETLDRLLKLLKEYGLPTGIPFPAEAVQKAARSDKKAAGSLIRLIVPEAIGRVRIMKVPAEELTAWLSDGGVR